MAVRRILLPLDRQPQGVVRLNQENKFARGIVAAVYPGGGVYTVASGITLGAGVRGQHWTLTGGTAQAIDVPSVGYATGSVAFSGIAIARSRGTGNQSVINVNYDGSTVPFILSIGGTGPVNGAGYFDGGWITSGKTTDVRNDGLWHVIGGAARSGSQRFFVDGRLDASAGTSGTSAHINTSPISFGAYKNDGASLAGDLAMGVVWANRFLSDDEFAELYENPNQIWEPISIWVPVSAGGGTDGNASTTPAGSTLTAPTATGSGSAQASTAPAGSTLTAPTATASASAQASGALAGVSLTVPTATATGTTAGNATATGAPAGLTLTAPTATASGSAQASGAPAGATLTAPTGTASSAGHAIASGAPAGLTMTAPTATATGSAQAFAAFMATVLTAPTATASNGDVASVLGSLAGSARRIGPTRSNVQAGSRSNRQTATR